METTASLTLQGLRGLVCVSLCKDSWFGVLLGSKSQVGKSPTYGSMKVVSYMLVFNVDNGPTRPGDLLDFGSEEIRRTNVSDHFRKSRMQDLFYSRSADLPKNHGNHGNLERICFERFNSPVLRGSPCC